MKRAQKKKRKGTEPGQRTAVQSESKTSPRGWLVPAAIIGLAAIAIIAFLIGDRDHEEAGQTTSSTEAEGSHGKIVFEDHQATSGIDFILNNGTTPRKEVIDSVLGGMAAFDYDNDGYVDVFFTNGAHIPSLEKRDPSFFNRLYRNRGDGSFEDVAERAGVVGMGYNMGVTVGDYDNDGWSDFFVAGVNHNILYHNEGNGTFTDVTSQAGVSGYTGSGKKPWSVAPAWLDYDNDGDIDLFVANYLDWSLDNNQLCGDPEVRLSCSPVQYGGLPNFLYRNNDDGTFTDVSAETGIAEHIGKGMSTAVNDFDGDGFMDIFVTNDWVRNFLFHNVEGIRFEEIGLEAGIAFNDDGVPISSMGLDFRDMNNDDLPDVVISALANEGFLVFVNTGEGYFTDESSSSQVSTLSFTMGGWGIGIVDLDNDGNKDIFSANSHVSENIEHYLHQEYDQVNGILQNLGNGAFRNVTDSAGEAMNRMAPHRGCGFADLNNDGRMDVVTAAIGAKPEVLINVSEPAFHWLIVDLEGTKSNRDGIGAKIRVTGKSGLVQSNTVVSSMGYAGSSDGRAYFGMGEDERAKEIEVRWPGGGVQVLKDVPSNQVLKITEE